MKKLVIFAILVWVIFGVTSFAFAHRYDVDIPHDVWMVETYSNDFGEQTNERFAYIYTKGRFSNSATSNSYLGVKIVIDSDSTGLFLYDYGRNVAEYFYSDDAVVRAKNSKGKKVECGGWKNALTKWNHNGGISIQCGNIKNLLITSTGKVKFYAHDGYSSVYVFEVNADGLVDALNRCKK